jgi:hypothetical protein
LPWNVDLPFSGHYWEKDASVKGAFFIPKTQTKMRPLQILWEKAMRKTRKKTKPHISSRLTRLMFFSQLSPKHSLLLFGIFFGTAVGIQIAMRQRDQSKPSLLALALRPAKDLFAPDRTVQPNDVSSLLQSVPLRIQAPLNGYAPEPPLKEGVPELQEQDAQKLGLGKSPFLIDSKWMTIRYQGEEPAGAGLSGTALEQAQRNAFGKENDTVPLVTATVTINRMMDEYFVPLLQSLPQGRELLSRIKVQGAFFAPSYFENTNEPRQSDNAYVVGLQSLYLYPSSCFESDGATREGCVEPFFSTGHDPTVIGHELGHVIFNHLRGLKTLEGFQWFAVNEGYADYFSASYFQDPFVGRIWKSNVKGAPYLRRLIDSPTVEDEQYMSEMHTFSVVWSSTLWRIREKLVQKFKIQRNDFDRVALFSITLLGETEKTRLGDAATALLKSMELLGAPQWKEEAKAEFQKAEITLQAPTDALLHRRGKDLNPDFTPKDPQNACGVIADKSESTSSHSIWTLLLLPLGLALLQAARRKPHYTWKRAFPLLGFLFFLQKSCKSGDEKEKVQPFQGYSLAYSCQGKDFEGSNDQKNVVYFTWYEPTGKNSPVQRVLVSDGRFERSPSALIVVLDRKSRRLEQARDRDGYPLQLSMTRKSISRDEALSYLNLRLATILLETAPNALWNSSKGASQEAGSGQKGVTQASFRFEEKTFQASLEGELKGAEGYGPLASRIVRNGENGAESLACQYEALLSSPN